MLELTKSSARRIALAAQGFAQARPKGSVTRRHFRRALDHMQVLQLDSVNVVCRSHFLPMFARLGCFERSKLDHWLWRSRENVEYVGHEASITPSSTRALLAHRFTENRWGREKIERDHPDYVQAILEEVRDRGALSVRDLSDPGKRSHSWWGGPLGKKTLEWLYTSGRLAICHRDQSFVTHYDLPERVLDEATFKTMPVERRAAQKALLMIAARSHGIGTVDDLADYFRIRMPEARPLIMELVEEGQLQTTRVEDWSKPGFLHPQAKRPRQIHAQTFLSPFDPIVWYRPRAARLFDFQYKIEIYTPAEKRIFGYYVLPFLFGDRIVGRADIKADRRESTLLAKACYLEANSDAEAVAPAFAASLKELAIFLGLDRISVGRKGNLSRQVAKSLRD
ncbi:winged helix-turn-helix domain-containing protein [Roseiconus lacunae]|uniref:Crosslink repair DNA glycosylase YcaQ family protein n=1 Tax=Roseiconus lacunae TaxID=2605694 RepID=A0ABT7PFC0_9BACT|nr:crosslink repair DNA glycosylase YcaQ family protein [Roseiconus lacunae]MDM4015200.1 crosslink repair DNA glycosylase YcaQ family protein [Roseiconus lacunae]